MSEAVKFPGNAAGHELVMIQLVYVAAQDFSPEEGCDWIRSSLLGTDAASSVLLAVATFVSGWLDGWVIDILLPRFCGEWAEDVQIEI
ncbi:hypothetical protein AXG93_2018s1070 [Marchantia polymorpha subsp. ruderalis]|uniref:Uncharacterized protein n=1 Tax=Marchantia polymorpha subsp. ruderalis TaxID=1480154 RepID=A0A176WF19_MARPO|nr:hypothetical protein AXG93_2018s1070 [Marchantia polymorpha subsp. ruderalis]